MKLLAKIVTCPYAFVLWLRNKCYHWGLIKSVMSDIPTISIGNITVGGTGKTPHTELILRLFSSEVPIAVLSGGYKRATQGFRYVTSQDSALDAGDEPLQIKRKFPSVVVAVCTNRIAAIKRIAHDHPQIKLIVLDDAFQYRKLKPTYSILLSDYARPFTRDLLLPFGRLRDLPSQASRADMIIVTKCPANLTPADRRMQQQTLRPLPHRPLLFTTLTYGTPQSIAASPPQSIATSQQSVTNSPRQSVISAEIITASQQSVTNSLRQPITTSSQPQPIASAEIIALTGIAQPKPFLQEIGKSGLIVQHLHFRDHHNFTQKDIARINSAAVQHPHAVIFTTEKDAMRLLNAPSLTPKAKAALFYIPIQAEFYTAGELNHFTSLTAAQFHHVTPL